MEEMKWRQGYCARAPDSGAQFSRADSFDVLKVHRRVHSKVLDEQKGFSVDGTRIGWLCRKPAKDNRASGD
jgi:hypothetical protein